jgi:hypothetical protein
MGKVLFLISCYITVIFLVLVEISWIKFCVFINIWTVQIDMFILVHKTDPGLVIQHKASGHTRDHGSNHTRSFLACTRHNLDSTMHYILYVTG